MSLVECLRNQSGWKGQPHADRLSLGAFRCKLFPDTVACSAAISARCPESWLKRESSAGTCWHVGMLFSYMGGCQNHGPFLGTLNIRCRIVIGNQKGTIILTTTRMWVAQVREKWSLAASIALRMSKKATCEPKCCPGLVCPEHDAARTVCHSRIPQSVVLGKWYPSFWKTPNPM